MTDQQTPDEAAPRSETVVGLITDGAYSLIVARFPTTGEAEDAYRIAHRAGASEQPADRRRRRRQPRCGRQGPPRQGHRAQHEDRPQVGPHRWRGLGYHLPTLDPRGAVAGGALGAAIGKIGNVSSRSDLAKELEGVLTPGSSGVIALVEDTAVVEIQKALAEADAIVTKAVNKQLAAEIDREAALAKESLGS